ncbi:MAG: hypothetical protein ABGW79_08605 [Pirellulales bacterium]
MVESSTITFQCPSCSSRITAPGKFAGKSGACSKCSAKVVIPKTQPSGQDSTSGSALVDGVSDLHESSADLLGPPVDEHSNSHLLPTGSIESPTARLIARLWQELEHGGEVELHIAGSSRPILPQFFERDWSQGTHALFARQEPDGSITLEAVAWESIQRVVVRKVQGLPDGMFLDEGES